MAMNSGDPAFRREICAPGVPPSPPRAPGAKRPTDSFPQERLKALGSELDEDEHHWTEQIAATVEEDYRQLLEDFGLS